MTDTSDLPRADATRARLLDAATAAFAEKGFHGTTTRDIATAAGMSSAALYVHHKSKEELLYLISRTGATRTRCSWYGRGSRPRTIPPPHSARWSTTSPSTTLADTPAHGS